MIRYAAVAQRLVYYGYKITSADVLTVSDLLQVAGTEEEIDHILVDDAAKQAARLQSLDKQLESLIAEYDRRRLRCPLLAASVPGTYAPTFCIGQGLSPQEQELRDRFRLVPDVRELLYAFTPREFEYLCGEVLRTVGCRGVSVSRRSKDDGVDAVAALPMAVALALHSPLYRLAGAKSFLVYAQAKAYGAEHPVEQDEVFEVQGSWEAMRNGFADGSLPEETRTALVRADYRSADPVFLLLVTTSRFTIGASSKASALGMLLLDGEQIAQLLVEQKYGLTCDASGAWTVDTAALVPQSPGTGT